MAEYIHDAGAEDKGAQLLFAIRAGTSRLRVTHGCWQGLAHEDRRCRLCRDGGVEDARHVLTECEALIDGRSALIAKLPPRLRQLADGATFAALMGGAGLRQLCPERPRRRAVMDAVKAFWCYALAKIENLQARATERP